MIQNPILPGFCSDPRACLKKGFQTGKGGAIYGN